MVIYISVRPKYLLFEVRMVRAVKQKHLLGFLDVIKKKQDERENQSGPIYASLRSQSVRGEHCL